MAYMVESQTPNFFLRKLSFGPGMRELIVRKAGKITHTKLLRRERGIANMAILILFNMYASPCEVDKLSVRKFSVNGKDKSY